MDPYEIMELSPSATDEEIKQAYRRLAKKYHPDLNPGDPVAADKMQKINAAYERIKTIRQGGTAGSGSSYSGGSGGAGASGGYGHGQSGPYGGGQGGPFGQDNPFGDEEIFRRFSEMFGGGSGPRQQPSSPRMQAVHHFIQNRQYQEALRVLSELERDAEWFYYSALANAGQGNRVMALNHAQEAARLDPGNAEYQSLLEQFSQGIFTYRQAGAGYGFDMGHMAKTMLQLCAAQACCMFFCRPC